MARRASIQRRSGDGFASFARLPRKRLNGLTLEQVDVSDLALTHFQIKEGGKPSALTPDGKFPTLAPITDNALCEARDREKAMRSDLVKRTRSARTAAAPVGGAWRCT